MCLSADNIPIPWIQTTMFEPVQIAEVSRISLLSPCVLAVLQYHVSQNDEASKCNDSATDRNKLCKTTMNQMCKSLWDWLSARELCEDSFPFAVKFLFCTEKLGTIKWAKLLHDHLFTCECCTTHSPHWELCGLLLSSHQTFRRLVFNHWCALCKKPLLILSFCVPCSLGLSRGA